MISFPTTSAGEVRKVGKWTPKQHPHHHLLRGVGVWWGSGKLEIAGGENKGVGGLLVLQMQARCPGGAQIEGAS
jgi:hypothetical protein